MIDWTIALISGLFGSWIFFIAIFFFAILAESYERTKWSVFLTVVMALSIYAVLDLSTLGYAWYVVIPVYAAIGMVHALWRWFRSTSSATKTFNKMIDDPNAPDVKQRYRDEIDFYQNATNYRENWDKLTYWTFAWPVSFAAHFIGDLVVAFKKMVTVAFSGLFDRISVKARGKAVIDVTKL